MLRSRTKYKRVPDTRPMEHKRDVWDMKKVLSTRIDNKKETPKAKHRMTNMLLMRTIMLVRNVFIF